MGPILLVQKQSPQNRGKGSAGTELVAHVRHLSHHHEAGEDTLVDASWQNGFKGMAYVTEQIITIHHPQWSVELELRIYFSHRPQSPARSPTALTSCGGTHTKAKTQ